MEDSLMKNKYIKPTINVLLLQQQTTLLYGSNMVKSIPDNNPEEFIFDSDGFDNEDILR